MKSRAGHQAARPERCEGGLTTRPVVHGIQHGIVLSESSRRSQVVARHAARRFAASTDERDEIVQEFDPEFRGCSVVPLTGRSPTAAPTSVHLRVRFVLEVHEMERSTRPHSARGRGCSRRWGWCSALQPEARTAPRAATRHPSPRRRRSSRGGRGAVRRSRFPTSDRTRSCSDPMHTCGRCAGRTGSRGLPSSRSDCSARRRGPRWRMAGFRALLLGQRGERAHPRIDLARRHVEQEQAGVPRHLLARGVADVREARRRQRLGRVDLADAEVLGGD